MNVISLSVNSRSCLSFLFDGQSRLHAVRDRIYERNAVQLTRVVSLGFCNPIGISKQFDRRVAHDFGSMSHSFMSSRQFSLRHHLPRMKRRANSAGRTAHLHGGDNPAYRANVS